MNYRECEIDPLVIGGSGGSGTRVVSQICCELGFYMGDLSYAFDSKVFENFFNKWTRKYLSGCDLETITKSFDSYLVEFLNGEDIEKWGFKNTRTLFFLPFFNDLFSRMKYIHVVRDGRDIPFSQNHRQPRELFDIYFERAWSQSTVFEDAARFWNKTNVHAFKIGKQFLGDRYLLIRLEDLCFDKSHTISKLLNFLQIDGDIEKLSEIIEEPKTFGRFKNHPEFIEVITEYTMEGLNEFGYET